ncbi:hypothetical protein ccbrp13_70920 [Ktedonobacteria bacterium brp13]|nr:hypothetical protein ccbrp13_70920 [Ktedonobacteria bacterium brp13]
MFHVGISTLGQHNGNEIGKIASHKEATHQTKNLPIPDKSQKHEMNGATYGT